MYTKLKFTKSTFFIEPGELFRTLYSKYFVTLIDSISELSDKDTKGRKNYFHVHITKD